jgi:hypothetical protein
VSTAAGTSAPDGTRLSPAEQRFGTLVVVGGGCYGSYYVRQLDRGARAGAVSWNRLVVVDRDAACAAARLPEDARPPSLSVAIDEWRPFFDAYLADAAADPAAHAHDAIVPSPLMPHLMADWLVERARTRWPARRVEIAPIAEPFDVRWQRSGADGTHYVSFADWICPINCIEPSRCPETRGPRSWSLPDAVRAHARGRRDESGIRDEALIFHCTHRAYGVGMIDVRPVVEADAAIAARGAAGDASFLVGTMSHCHGALRRIAIRD